MKKPLAIGCGLVTVLGVLACVAVIGFGLWLGQKQEAAYNKGHAAYLTGDCETAITSFNEIFDSGGRDSDVGQKATKEKQECEQFQVSVTLQKKGEFSGALLAYSNFISQSAESALVPLVIKQTEEMFNQAEYKDIAAVETCSNIETLRKRNLIPDPDTHLPPLYFACGQAFEAAQDYPAAIQMYELFREKYPDHELAEQVEVALAQAYVADAQATSAGNIPEPSSTNNGTGSGPATVVIQNDSPEKLQIVFSGVDTRIEEIPPCTECQDYQGEGPENCPELGDIGTYTLQPGEYSVVVKSISGSDVTPFTGNWTLDEGEEYYSCFYLVTAEN